MNKPNRKPDVIVGNVAAWHEEMICALWDTKQAYKMVLGGGAMYVSLSASPGIIHNSMLPQPIYESYMTWKTRTAESILLGE